MGARNRVGIGYRTGPPGYIGWRYSFLGIDSWAPLTFKNTGSGILDIACLPSAVDVCDVPIVSSAVAQCSRWESPLLWGPCYCCWCPCWMLLASLLSILAVLLLMTSMMNDDVVVPAAAVISNFNSIPAFGVIHTVLGVMLSFYSCCCLRSCCYEQSWYCYHPCCCLLLAVLLLLVAIIAVACIQTVAGIETKAERSFDLGFVFDMEAKRTCLFQNL